MADVLRIARHGRQQARPAAEPVAKAKKNLSTSMNAARSHIPAFTLRYAVLC